MRFKLNTVDKEITFEGNIIVKGCDNILSFYSDLTLSTPKQLKGLDATEDEENELELILSIAILDNDLCIQSP